MWGTSTSKVNTIVSSKKSRGFQDAMCLCHTTLSSTIISRYSTRFAAAHTARRLSLRPIDVHCGYVRRQYGYRQRTSPFPVTWSALSVLEKIHNIPDVRRRQRVMAAYTFLIDNQESSYRDFVRLCERVTRNPYDFKIYSHPQFRGIECALWPNLYVKTACCKSALDGSASRLSGKIAYVWKLKSNIPDFSTN